MRTRFKTLQQIGSEEVRIDVLHLVNTLFRCLKVSARDIAGEGEAALLELFAWKSRAFVLVIWAQRLRDAIQQLIAEFAQLVVNALNVGLWEFNGDFATIRQFDGAAAVVTLDEATCAAYRNFIQEAK